MAASLDDILTAQKNGVVAINGLAQATTRSLGTQTSVTVTAATVIYVGKGYLVNFSVVVAGTTAGTISNTGAVSTVAAANALCNKSSRQYGGRRAIITANFVSRASQAVGF